MALRFFIVPKVQDAKGIWRPKYFGALGLDCDSIPFGWETSYLCGANPDAGQLASLSANADVTTVPANLDGLITAGALPVVKSNLEALNIPAGWVTTANTYREVLRMVGRLSLFMQRFALLNGVSFFASGITLDQTVANLTVPQRQALIATASSFGIDSSSVSGSTVIRSMLKALADQIPAFSLVGEIF